MKRTLASVRLVAVLAAVVVTLLGGGAASLLGSCGPFTDVAADSFCPFVLEIFYLGITAGTTATTYDPSGNVTRLQMAAFLSRTVDAALKRGSRRAAMNQLWSTQNSTVLGLTTVGNGPRFVQFDGADLWVANSSSSSVSRIRASDARLLETWTGAASGFGLVVGNNRVVIAGQTSPGKLYSIDPSQPAGVVTTVAGNLGNASTGIAFDGARFWTANQGAPGSISIITPTASVPWTVTTLSVGVGSTTPIGALYDGSNVWITDYGVGALLKLDSTGSILQTVTIPHPGLAGFDGANLWVPEIVEGSVAVVRASNGSILGTLTGNGLNFPLMGGFDGERILVTNFNGDSVSLWKAADLTPLGNVPMGTGSHPSCVASDGIRFWFSLNGSGMLARF